MSTDKAEADVETTASGRFPARTLLWFVVVASLVRVGTVLGWALFPGTEGLQQLARILIPLLATLAFLALNRWCLRRDGFNPAVLGLAPSRLLWFAVGALAITPIILVMAGALWLAIPFHWERGTLEWSRFLWQFAEYIGGNFGEELIFRSYLLLVFARYFGISRALVLTGLLFGLFHLPGLAGIAALKMVSTTALGSVIFAAAYLLSGSLWTAVGAHAWGNLLLHQALGLSGQPAWLRVVWDADWPRHYDPPFVVWVLVSGLCAALLWRPTTRVQIQPTGSAP
jgi:membrane protease YdiL (CAAX protease family)